jgi:hypothetical protein
MRVESLELLFSVLSGSKLYIALIFFDIYTELEKYVIKSSIEWVIMIKLISVDDTPENSLVSEHNVL